MLLVVDGYDLAAQYVDSTLSPDLDHPPKLRGQSGPFRRSSGGTQ